MFQFAALRVLAERENAYLLLPSDCKLRRAFNLDKKVLFIEAKKLQKLIVENTATNFEVIIVYPDKKIFFSLNRIAANIFLHLTIK